MKQLLLALTAALSFLPVAYEARAQHEDMLVYSAASGGGPLVVDWGFEKRIRVTDRLGFCPGGRCFYSSTDPGFVSPSGGAPGESLYPLSSGIPVRFEVEAVDSGVSVKFGSTVLDAPGKSAALGNVPLHIHPAWQLEAAEGETGEYGVSFRLTSTAAGYQRSAVYRAILVNGSPPTPSPTPSATVIPSAAPSTSPSPTATVSATVAPSTPTSSPDAPSPSTTPTPVPRPCSGDCNGDSAVRVDELVIGVNVALGLGSLEQCPAFDTDGDGQVTVDELVRGVAAALGGCL